MFRLLKKTRDFDESQVMYWMERHNRGKIKIDYNYKCKPLCLISFVPIEELKLPDGWYYNTKNGLTNKHNSSTGLYSCIEIILE